MIFSRNLKHFEEKQRTEDKEANEYNKLKKTNRPLTIQ